jgi:hypothetical protein
VRITRLRSKSGRGAELVAICRAIAERERARYPSAYEVVQARQPLEGQRIELVSITYWIDLDLMARLMPRGAHTEPAFWTEYAHLVDTWEVEVFEVTWSPGA